MTVPEPIVLPDWFAAVIVTFCCEVTISGAVYSPPEVSVPGVFAGIVHVTPVAHAPVTANCSAWVAYRLMDAGTTCDAPTG